jgi:acetyl-CoA carboxylase carboxyltransferase component
MSADSDKPVRADLAAVIDQHALGLDAARKETLAKRRALGKRSARENVADLCDPGSFVEYGALAIAAQRSRRKLEELKRDTPADGMVTGIGQVNGAEFGAERSRCVVLSYDYSVLAGTQGFQNHRKTDRMVRLASEQRLPVIFFAEGGGGRPGDVDTVWISSSGLEVTSFYEFARLSGRVPLVGINAGRCFAGNAAFFGCCDLTIATRDANVGMGGPAMIEGGGLGSFKPEEIGPTPEQAAIGVIDFVVEDEAEAVRIARQYLSYFQGALKTFQAPDPAVLRELIPENRRMSYDVRRVVDALADQGSVLELRRAFAPNLVTALIRIEGRPLGVLANNPSNLAGAIDSPAADKAARFMRLCDAHGLPLLTLCDTPGIMVSPAAEKTGTVRHASRMFLAGAQVRVPWFGIVLRKAYGLGAQAMLGGHLKRPQFVVAWPTAEFGPMGLEGAVKLGFRRELERIADPAEREKRFGQFVADMYEQGKATSVATFFEIDDVIDPAESRRWLVDGLRSVAPRAGDERGGFIDAW